MKLEQQVCSLDLAKRLKELGVKQESCFTWVESIGDEELRDGTYKLQSFNTQFYGAVSNHFAAGFHSPKHPMFSAFTVAELGEMLPAEKQIPRKYYEPDADGMLWCIYLELPKATIIQENTEADARAKMLIYLLESGLLK